MTMVGANNNIPSSKEYLLIDTKKCTGCCSCMLACSLIHEGVAGYAPSRIQILNDAFGTFPTDVDIATCQQCDNAECYLACPLKDEALCIDESTGVRYINAEKCTGCKLCIKACRFSPPRIKFDFDRMIAIKCDLCKSVAYRYGNGRRACVDVCPVNAIKSTGVKPVGYIGYRVNLRGEGWKKLGFPTD